jgi:hypothetical protein
MTSNDTINENNEIFTKGTYNGISILERNKDGYVNPGKMCLEAGKDLYNFTRGERWKNIVKYWEEEGSVKLRNPMILKKGYNECQGTYIHPDLYILLLNGFQLNTHSKSNELWIQLIV